MDRLRDSYLLFYLAGFSFLLPLQWVERVSAMSERDPELPLAVGGGLEFPPVETGQPYLIIVRCRDLRFGIGAESVAGLAEIGEERIHGIPEGVMSSHNRYLKAMALLEGEDGGYDPAFVLDPLAMGLE